MLLAGQNCLAFFCFNKHMEVNQVTKGNKRTGWLMFLVLFGPFVVMLGVGSMTLERLMQRPIVTKMAGYLIGRQIGGGADLEQSVAVFKLGLRRQGGCGIVSPQIRVEVCLDEIENKTPEEARDLVFTKAVEKVYDRGFEGVSELTGGSEIQSSKWLEPVINFFSKENRELIQAVSLLLAATSLIWIILLGYLERGFGRLIWPGVLMLVGGVIGLLPAVALSMYFGGAAFAQEIRNVVLFGGLVPVLGVFLIVLSLFGAVVQKIFRKE